MNNDYLDFEQPLAELEAKISELRNVSDDNAMNIDDEIHRLEEKLKHKTEQIFSNLSDWQISQLARHPKRPYTKDYIKLLMTTFDELHGDRAFADDPAIIGGLAEFRGKPVMVIGHQKGRSTKEKIRRNCRTGQRDRGEPGHAPGGRTENGARQPVCASEAEPEQNPQCFERLSQHADSGPQNHR